MKKIILSLFLILATATSVFAMSFNEAKKQGKPVVVMFHMHGCSACRKFSPMFDKMALKFPDKFNFVKEDTNKSDLAKSLNFMTVPAIFIINPNTMAAKRIEDDCAWDNACFAKRLQDYNY